ncbi:MAG: hypothetical protein QM602_01620 [Microbacterium sp.]
MQPVDVAKRIAARRRSPYTEVHRVPRTDERAVSDSLDRQAYAVARRELGERDWAAIDPMLVRISKGVRHRFTSAMYFWQRTRSHVWCESQEERWEVLWLDYGAQVERLWAQPLAVAFGHGSPLAGHWHIPDLLAQFTDGSYGLFDVRPAERMPLLTGRTAVSPICRCRRAVVYSEQGEGVTMGEIRTTTREALAAEREELLRALGRDEASLRTDAALGALAGDEWYALERLDAIAFLLGEPAFVAA